MAFLLSSFRPVAPPIQAFTKTWIRCLSDFSDYVRPPGPISSWTREQYNTHYRWKYATNSDYRKKIIEASVKRYANDPVWRQAKLQKEQYKYHNDPDWRQARLQKSADRYANDPEHRQSVQQKFAEQKERCANDPEFRQAILQRKRERYANNPRYKAYQKQRYAERRLRDKSELTIESAKSKPQKVSNPQDKSDGSAFEPRV